jgi:hypothetical protein
MRNLTSSIIRATTFLFALPGWNQSVQAVAESGTADAGIASKAIQNVAANDAVNGAPATLGS